MSRSDASQETSHQSSVDAPLSLFRAEAQRAPERLYGDIISIRPFSSLLLGSLAAGMLVTISGFLVFGKHTEIESASGFVVSSTAPDNVLLRLPKNASGRSLPALWLGQQVTIRCVSCPEPSARTLAQVGRVALSTARETREGSGNGDVLIALAVSRPRPMTASQDSPLMRPGATVELAVPVGQRTFMHWLFEPEPQRTGK